MNKEIKRKSCIFESHKMFNKIFYNFLFNEYNTLSVSLLHCISLTSSFY